MQSPFPFDGMILFGWMASMLLIGVVLRANIPFLQKFLFPSCLIGGIMGLVLVNFNLIQVQVSALETYAYHFFNISFISVGLTASTDQENAASPGKEYLKGPAWMALVQGACFGIQAAIGGVLVIAFGLIGLKLFPTFGFLVPLGFEEGPGQALSVGKVWEGFGFAHGATIGLTFASIGFFFAFFVGVPLVNWGIRKGLASHGPKELPQDLLIGIMAKDDQPETAGELTLHSGNIDTLAFQAAMVGLVYILTYYFVKTLSGILPSDAGKILWGFFFIFGLVIAIGVRFLLRKAGVERLINPGVQRRITGWSVDFLIVATVMAIQLAVVMDYLIPITVISLVNGIATTLFVVYLGRRVTAYHLERTAAVYGAVTGTVSCGLLLLRIADPEFKTPVAIEIAIMNVFSIPIIGVCLVLVNGPVWWQWSTGLTVVVFTAIAAVALVLLKVFKLWGQPTDR